MEMKTIVIPRRVSMSLNRSAGLTIGINMNIPPLITEPERMTEYKIKSIIAVFSRPERQFW